ncbi:MAG TPA: hypothetical protein VF634_10250 [Pyrinomonadaceae bacterium]
MNESRLPATGFKSDGGDATGRGARSAEPVGAERKASMRRTVGVYERPAQRGKLSLPLIVILILATLISLVLSVRFLF